MADMRVKCDDCLHKKVCRHQEEMVTLVGVVNKQVARNASLFDYDIYCKQYMCEKPASVASKNI